MTKAIPTAEHARPSPRAAWVGGFLAVMVFSSPVLAQMVAPQIPAPQQQPAQQQSAPQSSSTGGAPTAPNTELDDLTVYNRQLEQRLNALRGQLMGDVCASPRAARSVLEAPTPQPLVAQAPAQPAIQDAPPQGVQPVTPLAQQPDQSAQATQATQPDPANANEPPPADQLAAKPPANADDAQLLSSSDLVARMNRATVLVLAGNASGSGFFVAPDLIVTNHHVVAASTNGEVAVVGEGLDRPHIGKVISTTGDRGHLGPDYALVRINNFKADTMLSLSTKSESLQKVVATGYPGLLLGADQNFQDLMNGDLTALPSLVFSEGSIMAVQSGKGGVTVLAHSADISGGNSGGPLVDYCGNVVGINTLVAVDQQQSRNAGYALSSEDLAQWLQTNGVQAATHNALCASP